MCVHAGALFFSLPSFFRSNRKRALQVCCQVSPCVQTCKLQGFAFELRLKVATSFTASFPPGNRHACLNCIVHLLAKQRTFKGAMKASWGVASLKSLGRIKFENVLI